MGSEDFYPEERPVRAGRGRRLLDRRGAGDRRAVPALRARDRVGHGGRARPRPGARLARLPPDRRTGAARRLPAVVVVRRGRLLASAGGPGSDTYTRGQPPGRARDARGRGGVCGLGGRGAADRGRVGVRGARRRRTSGSTAGTGSSRGAAIAGRRPSGRSRPTTAGCSTWSATCGSGPPTRTTPAHGGCCGPATRERGAAARDQGRLAPVRAQLLPPLSPRGAAGRGDRHLDEPHRLPLHRPARDGARSGGGGASPRVGQPADLDQLDARCCAGGRARRAAPAGRRRRRAGRCPRARPSPSGRAARRPPPAASRESGSRRCVGMHRSARRARCERASPRRDEAASSRARA